MQLLLNLNKIRV